MSILYCIRLHVLRVEKLSKRCLLALHDWQILMCFCAVEPFFECKCSSTLTPKCRVNYINIGDIRIVGRLYFEDNPNSMPITADSFRKLMF